MLQIDQNQKPKSIKFKLSPLRSNSIKLDS